ncbi:MAG: hypothetical protein PVI79_09040 [Gammaproteobacteria bacterium]|jgi:hypothetical protein
MVKTIALAASAIVLSACAGAYNPQYNINEIVVNNNSDQAVRDVSIRAGGRVFQCANIAPYGMCSNRFPQRKYQNEAIEIDWALGSGASRSDSLQLEVPATFITGLSLRGVVDVSPDGDIAAHFEQDSPLR